MIDCGFVQENLSAYIDDELPIEEGRQVHHHLQTCQVCNKEYTELLITATIMRSLHEIEPPFALKDRIKDRLMSETVATGPVARIKKVKWYSFGAVAAGLLLMLGSWGLLFDGSLAKFPAVDSAGTQEIALLEPQAGGGSAPGEELMSQPFSLAVPEAEAPPEEKAALAVQQSSMAKEADGDAAGAAPGYGGQEATAEAAKELSEPKETPVSREVRSSAPGTPAENGEFSIASLGVEEEDQAVNPEHNVDKTTSSRMLAARPVLSENGLRLELELKTQDLSQTHKAIERIAQVHELDVSSQENERELQVEVLVPISQQGAVLEELKGLGYVTGEVASDPDLNKRINDLITDQRELAQQQIELRALLNNGGTPENMEAWQRELSAVSEEADKISAEISELEAKHGLTCIKLTLVK